MGKPDRIKLPLWERITILLFALAFTAVIVLCGHKAFSHGQHMDASGSGRIVIMASLCCGMQMWGVDTDHDGQPDKFVTVALIDGCWHYLDVIGINGR